MHFTQKYLETANPRLCELKHNEYFHRPRYKVIGVGVAYSFVYFFFYLICFRVNSPLKVVSIALISCSQRSVKKYLGHQPGFQSLTTPRASAMDSVDSFSVTKDATIW